MCGIENNVLNHNYLNENSYRKHDNNFKMNVMFKFKFTISKSSSNNFFHLNFSNSILQCLSSNDSSNDMNRANVNLLFY